MKIQQKTKKVTIKNRERGFVYEKICLTVGVALLIVSLSACLQNTEKVEISKHEDAATVLTEVKTTQFFTNEKVADKKDNPDAVTSATIRNAFDEVVTIIGQ